MYYKILVSIFLSLSLSLLFNGTVEAVDIGLTPDPPRLDPIRGQVEFVLFGQFN